MSNSFRLGIIAAMEEEIDFLRSKIESLTITKEGTIELYSGSIDGVNVVLVRSGIGKVNAAVAATLLIRDFKPTCIVNTGSAGGLKSDMEVGDIVVSSKVFHHDFDLKPIGFQHGEIPGLPVFFESDKRLVSVIEENLNNDPNTRHTIGQVGTGEFFVSSEDYVSETKRRFPEVVAIEMEAAAIAQVCFQFDVPFVVIRAISDVADKESPMSFDQFVKVAGKKSAEMLLSIVQDIKGTF